MSELEVMAYISGGLFVGAFFVLFWVVVAVLVMEHRDNKAVRHYTALAKQARYEKIRKKELEAAESEKNDEFFKKYERYFDGV